MRLFFSFINQLMAQPFSLIGILFAHNKWLCAQLLWMAQRDQRKRTGLAKTHLTQTAILQLSNLDQNHTQQMKQIVRRHGWSGEALVGPMGVNAAWLLVQHADHDLAFQKICLTLLESAVQRGDAQPRYLACLIDRIRVAEGLPQVYGTQFHGQAEPLPIENEAKVDERRAAMGLEPLADYVKFMNQMHGNRKSK
jgi:hypothetical protein